MGLHGVSTVLRTVCSGGKSEICQRSLIRSYVLERLSLESVQRCFGGKVSAKRYRLSRANNKYQYQTAQLLKLEFIFHFISTCVCVHKSDASDTQAE